MGRSGASSSGAVRLLRVEGIAAPVEVRRHPTARRLTLRVSRTRHAVILTMPRGSNLREADQFLYHSLDWVKARLACVPEPAPFRHGATLPLRGELHELAFIGPGRGRPVIKCVAPAAGATPCLLVSGAAEHAPRRLKDWLMRQAGKDLDSSVAVHARKLDARPRRITLRDQKSRWGSCSSDGQLSFSWRLVLAPPHVLDYVAAHEVAHLLEMNHGPRFWRLVAGLLPRYEEARAWLRIYGMDLYRYGIEP